jgi:hypothetical protein
MRPLAVVMDKVALHIRAADFCWLVVLDAIAECIGCSAKTIEGMQQQQLLLAIPGSPLRKMHAASCKASKRCRTAAPPVEDHPLPVVV